MKLPNISGLVGVGKAFVQANRPEILFGASIVSTVAAVVAAARGGYKSGQQVLIEEIGGAAKITELTNKEKASLTWINYLPAAGLTAGALGSTTGLHIVHVKEKKQLAAAALMAIEEVKKEAKSYEKSLKELGVATSDDPDKLEEAADKKGVARVSNSDGEIEELYLVRDARSGRDIWSNKLKIEDTVIELNNVLNGQGDAELNWFYTNAGFNSIPEGEVVGWSGCLVSLKWKNVERSDGRPVKEFWFLPEPAHEYRSGN